MAGEWAQATFQYDAPGLGHTFSFIMDKIENFLLQTGWERPTWDGGTFGPGTFGYSTSGSADVRHFIRTDRNTQLRWRYTGDLAVQNGGIVVWYNADPTAGPYGPNLGGTGSAGETGPQIVVQSFLENTAQNGAQVYTPDHVGALSGGDRRWGSIRLRLDNLSVNNWLIYGGEDGLYFEVGRDGVQTNLGHGILATFAEFTELNGTRGEAVQWTAQGLPCDLFGRCRFSENRAQRFVTNDGTNKNFTASLQPYSPRGTADLDSTAVLIQDQRPYYIGARDNIFSIAYGRPPGVTAADAATSSSGQSVEFACSMGLINTPKNGRVRISPMVMLQAIQHAECGASNVSTSLNNIAGDDNALPLIDIRDLRKVNRWAAMDYTLLPFVNVTDGVSGQTYRVFRMDDDGRFSQGGIEVPATTLTLP